MAKQPKKRQPPRVTWAQAFRDILIASMNKGQLPIMGLILFAFLIVWKMPPEDVSALASSVVESLKVGELYAYILLTGTVFGWYTHTKGMRKMLSEEYQRIGIEKSKLQSSAANLAFKSSDN